jgi:AraC-like DNA-binding protein
MRGLVADPSGGASGVGRMMQRVDSTRPVVAMPALRESTHGDVALVDFRTQDPEAAHAHIRPNHGDHQRTIHGGDAFGYAESTAATSRIVLGQVQRVFRQTLRAAVRHPTLFLDLDPGDTLRYGRRTYDCGPSLARVLAPGQEYTRQGSARRACAVRVDTLLLQQAIAGQARGRARNWLVQPVAIPMPAAKHEEMSALFAQIRGAARPDGSWGIYGSVETFERAVADWIAALLLDASGAVPTSEQNLHRLAVLDRWIELHLGEEVTLDRMCAVTGTSARALQKIMLSARGQTPLEFLSNRRLAAVRTRLDRGSPRERVSSVALDCGFRHLGRFAATYRAAFGELPADTVQRRAVRLRERGSVRPGD